MYREIIKSIWQGITQSKFSAGVSYVCYSFLKRQLRDIEYLMYLCKSKIFKIIFIISLQ